MAEDDKKQDVPETPDQVESDVGAVLASWKFDEHDRHARSFWWYASAVVLVLGLLAYAYYDNNMLFAVVVLLIVFAFLIAEYRGPDRHIFAITEDGIFVADAFYPYENIQNFFIYYEPGGAKMLYFDPKQIYRPLTGIPLGDEDPNEIREILLSYLPEDLTREEEPTSDWLGRLLKF